MLTHPTLDQLRALKLDGMADAFIELKQQDMAKDLSHAEWLALLIDREMANRNTKRLQIRLRAARLRHGQACVEDVDYRAQQGSASHGWRAPLRIKPVATATPPSTRARRVSSRSSSCSTAMAASPGCSGLLRKSIS